MESSVVTIPTDSRFVNAVVFLLFDVLVFNLLAILLTTLHASTIKRRLIRGHRVKLCQTSLSPFLGGLLSDATPLTYAFILLHLTFIALFFLLTLGINGRSDTVAIPAQRQYLTRIAANSDFDFNRNRLRPTMFSACLTTSNSSIRYYPTAFNTKGTVPLEDFFDFRDKDGNRVSIDVRGMLCQNTGEIPPMLTVRRCGESMDECGNLEIGPDVQAELLPVANSSRRTERSFIVWVGQPSPAGPGVLAVMYRSMKLNPLNSSSVQYNRLICKERPTQGEENPRIFFYFNCVMGRWDEEEFLFTFRFAQMRFERTLEKHYSVLGDFRTEGTEVTVTMVSAEMVVEWDAKKDGETLFADALSAIGQDAVTGRGYLNAAVSRLVVADLIRDGVQVVGYEERLVTDVEVVALVGYGIIGMTTVVGWMALWVYGKRLKRYGEVIDVTSFKGMARLLRRDFFREGDETKKKWIEFGVAKKNHEDSAMYKICAVNTNDVVVSLPSGEMLS